MKYVLMLGLAGHACDGQQPGSDGSGASSAAPDAGVPAGSGGPDACPTATGSAWQRVGRSPYAPLTGLTADPGDAEVLFGSNRLGLFRSTDGGASFCQAAITSLDRGPLLVTAIAEAPQRRIAVAESIGLGRAVLTSDDAGLTWVRQESDTFDLLDVTTSPIDGTLYARVQTKDADPTSGLAVSEDFGASWRLVEPGENAPSNTVLGAFTSAVPHPTQAGVLFTASGRLYRSEDAGRSWGELSFESETAFDCDANPGGCVSASAMAVLPTEPITLLVTANTVAEVRLYWSTDGGDTFDQSVVADHTTEAVLDFKVHQPSGTLTRLLAEPDVLESTNPGDAFLDTFQISTDFGETWVERPLPEQFILALAPEPWPDPGDDQHWILPTAVGIYESRDSAGTWSLLDDGVFPVGEELHVALRPGSTSQLLVQSGEVDAVTGLGLLSSDDGGASLVSVPTASEPYTFAGLEVLYDPDGTLLWTSDSPIQVSNDDGETWQPRDLPESALLLNADAGAARILYARDLPSVATPCRLWRSINAGSDWSCLHNGIDAMLVLTAATDPANLDRLYAITTETILFSDDGGTSWQDRGTQGLPPRPTDEPSLTPHLVFASSRLFLAHLGALYRSEDAAETWQRVHDDALRPVPDPGSNGTLYLVGQSSLYKTGDGGSTWVDAGAGLPIDDISNSFGGFQISTSDPDTLYFALDDFGIYRSTSGGVE